MLAAAWRKFSRGKCSRADAKAYRVSLSQQLDALVYELCARTYRHGSYTAFTVQDPKTRRIHKAAVRDRIVHQLLVDILEPVFEPRFIHDSFSCRHGKGTHAGVARLRTLLGRASRNDSRTVYALKCDIRQFFASVDLAVLRECIAHRIESEEVPWLVDEVLGSFSPGIPLGNVTSQLFTNVYLHELDWFVKQQLGVRHYIRYCDDFVMVLDDPGQIPDILRRIDEFVRERLRIELHPHKVSVRTWRQGIDFLGYVLKPHATLVRTKTARCLVRRATQANINLYLGVLSHADSYELSQVLRLVAL